MKESKNKINAHIEFHIELPFNLALPTGHYTLDFPNQIRIRRDMYLCQKGNEIENIATVQSKLEPQERFFNEHGLVNESLSEFQYKRKTKTIFYARYKMFISLNIKESDFHEKLANGKITARELKISPKIIIFFHNRFKRQVNEFLAYYINYFPINHITHLLQHEVQPLSTYQFSKCETGITIVYKNIGIPLPKIIDDYNNYTGIPEFTYRNDLKIEEFEKIIQNRAKYKILPHQDMFNLARSLFRTNKENMSAPIIINAITAIETILNLLEKKDSKFQELKLIRKKTRILNFYLNPYRKFKKTNRPIKTIRKTTIIFSKLIKTNHPEIKIIKRARKVIRNLNYGRLIRNEIIHNGKIRYNISTDIIRFNLKPFKIVKKAKFQDLWTFILEAYYALNLHILELLYLEINWRLRSDYSKSHIASSTTKSEGELVSIIPNYDWREIYSYKYNLPEFAVPPEKFPMGLITKDKKIINLNVDFERGKYELVGQIMLENEEFKAEWISWNVDYTYEDIKKRLDTKNFSFTFDRKDQQYHFQSCLNCGFIIPVHMHIKYNNNKCPKCKTEFDLQKYTKQIWVNLFVENFSNKQYNKSINYISRAIKIDTKDKYLWNDYGLNLLKLEKIKEAITCFDKALEIDKNYGDSLYNKACGLALNREKDETIKYLSESIEVDDTFRDKALEDPDFDLIRHSKAFHKLTSREKIDEKKLKNVGLKEKYE